MIKNLFIGLLFLLAAAPAVTAQSPAPLPDTIDPVIEGDPAVQQLPRGQTNYLKNMDRVATGDVPENLRRTLESSEKYANWEKAKIYRDKTGDEYLIQYTKGDTTITYRFHKDGRRLLYD